MNWATQQTARSHPWPVPRVPGTKPCWPSAGPPTPAGCDPTSAKLTGSYRPASPALATGSTHPRGVNDPVTELLGVVYMGKWDIRGPDTKEIAQGPAIAR